MKPSVSTHGVPGNNEAVVLTWDAPTVSDRRAQAIAAFLGVEAAFAPLATSTSSAAPQSAAGRRRACAIVTADTLARAAESRGGANALAPLVGSLSALAERVFVYGFQPTDRHNDVLRALSGDLLRGVHAVADSQNRFDVAARREWCGAFSGLSFDAGTGREMAFVAGEAGDRAALIRLAGSPFLVSVEQNGCQVLLCAETDVADLDETVVRSSRVLSWFSRLIPLMMFLRGALGTRVWRNDRPRACFIIDDPALQARHGFLEYRRLIESLRRHQYTACIAFIPWNYQRSHRLVAKLVAASGAPGLCVHGCDHTRGEFAAADVELLTGKSCVALERMRAHRRLTGVPFDEVMVFPQGLFSTAALPALEAAGFLAAINTDLFPSTGDAPALTLRDVLDVAVTKYSGVPLFGRRYPKHLAEFAFDLFLGKPAFVVEHHGYFREGFAAIESFAAGLRRLDPRLEWALPGAICSQASLTRTTASGDVQERFYCNRAAAAPSGGAAWKATPIEAASVRIRRHLSEFRDNHVDTNRVLSSAVDGARRARKLIAV